MTHLRRGGCVLLLVDFQERLMPAITDGPSVISRGVLVAQAAKRLDVPVLATEQYPKGLGHTVSPLQGFAGRTVVKLSFNSTAEPGLQAALAADRQTVVVAGCEAHVCVLQTVLGLLGSGKRVAIVSDAVGSRRLSDRDAALARLSASGAECVTSEMVVFEWLERADHPAFRDLLPMIR